MKTLTCIALGLPLIALAFSCGHGALPSAPTPLLGKAVSITLPTDGGEQVVVPGLDKKKLVLEFFSPSCESCGKRLALLVDQRDALNARGARLVLIAVLGENESIDQARAALQKWDVTWPFLVDNSGACRPYLGVSRAPAALIIDAKGKLVWSAPQGATASDIVAAIR
jgi:peroxiredoxin